MMNYVFWISFSVLLYVVYRLGFGTTKIKMIIGTVTFVATLLVDATIISFKIQKYITPYFCRNEPIMRWIVGVFIGVSIMSSITLIYGALLFEVYKQKNYEKNIDK